jgi:hypothetical protein
VRVVAVGAELAVDRPRSSKEDRDPHRSAKPVGGSPVKRRASALTEARSSSGPGLQAAQITPQPVRPATQPLPWQLPHADRFALCLELGMIGLPVLA